jgi:hypothetical protein
LPDRLRSCGFLGDFLDQYLNYVAHAIFLCLAANQQVPVCCAVQAAESPGGRRSVPIRAGNSQKLCRMGAQQKWLSALPQMLAYKLLYV